MKKSVIDALEVVNANFMIFAQGAKEAGLPADILASIGMMGVQLSVLSMYVGIRHIQQETETPSVGRN